MKTVKLLQDAVYKKKGSIVTLKSSIADLLIKLNKAEEYKEKPKRKTKKDGGE